MGGNTTDFAVCCNSSKNDAASGKMMIIPLIACFTFCLISILYSLYQHCYNYTNNLHTNQFSINTSRKQEGLLPSVLQSLSTFVYSSSSSAAAHGPREVLECAVCLAEFEEKDLCRMLPKCCHVFHVECIDTWFVSHSNCPLCRTSVQALEPNTNTQTAGSVPQVAIDI